jgi:hypothetical protein
VRGGYAARVRTASASTSATCASAWKACTMRPVALVPACRRREPGTLMLRESIMTRAELYELVWKEPMIHAAKRFGLSDVALRKTCVKHEDAALARGYNIGSPVNDDGSDE